MVAGGSSDQVACVHPHKPQLAEIGFFQQFQNGVDGFLASHFITSRSSCCFRLYYTTARRKTQQLISVRKSTEKLRFLIQKDVLDVRRWCDEQKAVALWPQRVEQKTL